MQFLKDKPLRLRDFIRVGDLYFSVIGYNNKKYVKSMLRYAPSKNGKREKNGKFFKKLNFDEAVEIGKEYFSRECGIFKVRYDEIDEIYKPEERLPRIEDVDVKKVVEFFSGIPMENMGITGSRLIGLEDLDSDIDFVMYGKWWFKGREKIKKGIERGELSEPDEDTWEFIYKKRSPPLTYESFLLHEKRKFHRAFIGSTYFDLLYVRDYQNLTGKFPEKIGKKVCFKKLRGVVTDDSLVFDYPAYYPIKNSEVEAVVSFTHTFAGQAFAGELIEASGWIEVIDERRYLIAGSKREVRDEYIVSLTLLKKANLNNFLLDAK